MYPELCCVVYNHAAAWVSHVAQTMSNALSEHTEPGKLAWKLHVVTMQKHYNT